MSEVKMRHARDLLNTLADFENDYASLAGKVNPHLPLPENEKVRDGLFLIAEKTQAEFPHYAGRCPETGEHRMYIDFDEMKNIIVKAMREVHKYQQGKPMDMSQWTIFAEMLRNIGVSTDGMDTDRQRTLLAIYARVMVECYCNVLGTNCVMTNIGKMAHEAVCENC